MSSSTLFLRKATGLVRSWSVFDAFVYAFFSINLITLGLYIFSQMYYLEGGLLTTAVVSGIIILTQVVVYAGLIAVMPRAGGDYVWQSRILGGGIGFVLAVTGWWFILWLWTPIYADMGVQTTVKPIFRILGFNSGADFLSKPAGIFVAVLVVIAIASILVAIGMKTYAKMQKYFMYIGLALSLAWAWRTWARRAMVQRHLDAERRRERQAAGTATAPSEATPPTPRKKHRRR